MFGLKFSDAGVGATTFVVMKEPKCWGGTGMSMVLSKRMISPVNWLFGVPRKRSCNRT